MSGTDQNNGCIWWVIGAIILFAFAVWQGNPNQDSRPVPDYIRDAPAGHNRGGDSW